MTVQCKNPGPSPRPAELPNCIAITAYGSCFLFFFIPWLREDALYFWQKIGAIFVLTAGCHFLLLYRRDVIYKATCRVLREPVRFFEFPYVLITGLFYVIMFFVAPGVLGLVELDAIGAELIGNQNRVMHMISGCGAILVIAVISGFDIYPVNYFTTQQALQNLISITRDLMKACNRSILILSGSIIVGWAFKKVELSPHVIYLTMYAIIGFSVGTTAVLGARLTELLYKLSDIENELQD